MKTVTGSFEHWTDYKTKLKMSTMDQVLKEYHQDHGTTERGTINEVHIWLAKNFGHIGTRKALREALEKS